MPYVPFAMILRQRSYTISRSLTCLPIFPCPTVLQGKSSFTRLDNATFYRFGISFAQSLHAKLQQPAGGGVGKKRSHPYSFSKRTGPQNYPSSGFKQKGLCLLLVSSLKRHLQPLTVLRIAQWYHRAARPLCA